MPVRVKKTRQNKEIEPPSRLIGTEALSRREDGDIHERPVDLAHRFRGYIRRRPARRRGSALVVRKPSATRLKGRCKNSDRPDRHTGGAGIGSVDRIRENLVRPE